MPRSRPRAAFALACALLLSTVSGATTLAANTRVVFFGSPGTTTNANGLGVLTTTSVTAGGATATDVILTNLSPSQLTHVVIQGGAAAPDPLANTSFPAPSPICPSGATSSTQCLPSLPTGTSYLAAYVQPTSTVGVTCAVSSTGLDCAVANMKPNDVAAIRVILQPPTTAGSSVQFWLATSLKEGTSNTGSNQDTFFAYGTFGVVAPSCAQISTFFQSGQQPALSNTSAGGCNQATNVAASTSFQLGAFTLVGAAPGSFCAPGITSCFGELSQANVNFGIQPSGTFITWDIVWSGADLPNGRPSGVTHFLDGYDPASNPKAFVNITFKQKDLCSSATQSNCWVSTVSTKTSFEAIFRTPTNGLIRGY